MRKLKRLVNESPQVAPVVWCNNVKCQWYQLLETPVKYNFDKMAFNGFSEDVFTGKCVKKTLTFDFGVIQEHHTGHKIAYCEVSAIGGA
jgi:hypothetical protein